MTDRRKLLVRGGLALVLLGLFALLGWRLGRREPPGAALGVFVEDAPAASGVESASTTRIDTSEPAEAAGTRTRAVVPSPTAIGAILEGTVRNPAGIPIPGAWVRTNVHGLPGRTGWSDLQGHWRALGLEPGLLLEVEAHARGFLAARVEPRTRLIAGRREVFDLVLTPAPGFCGRVLDARSNRPVVQAEVRVVDAPQEWLESRAATDGEGRFQLAGLLETRVRVMVAKDGYAHETAEWEASGAEHLVRLQPADADVVVTVLRPDGSPAAGAWVNVSTGQGAFANSGTDEHGRLRLGSLPTGPAHVFAFVQQGLERKSRLCVVRDVELQSGENELELELQQGAACRLAGRLTHENAPAAGVRLIVTQQAPAGVLGGNLEYWVRYADGDGRFELGNLLPLHYIVQVENFDGSVGLPARYVVDLAPGEAAEELDFRVVAGISFKGRVATPFAEKALTIELWEAEGAAPLVRKPIDDRGQTFELEGLAPARYRLRLLDRDRLAAELELGPESRNGIELLPRR